MTTRILNDQQILEFSQRGVVVVPGFFNQSEMQSIIGWVNEVQSWPESPGKHMMYFEQSSSEPGRRLLNRLENFIPYHDGLARVVRRGKLLDSVSELFDEDAILFKEKINFKLPGGGGFEPHQDAQAAWNRYATMFITATVTVDASTTENGCLEFANWQHRRELIGDLWRPLDEGQITGIPFEFVPTEPGDAVFFDCYVPHRSAPNLASSPRRMLYVTYNPASEGDHRVQYFADKRRGYPPDCEREDGKDYEYKV